VYFHAGGQESLGFVNRDWKHLQAMAEAEVQATLQALPLPVREQAAPLPITCLARPSKAMQADGYEPDLLGLFVGSPFAESGSSALPPQIMLFLENLWDFSGRDDEDFRDEVRTTYLHELGHYLGLDEIDLEERGLE
jgi:predicted Zn-dependent protease with MMP-like domain